MEELYIDIVTFIAGLEPLVKILIIGLLAIFIGFNVMAIIKTHVNPKKSVFKFGQFLLLAILVIVEVFICIHSI